MTDIVKEFPGVRALKGVQLKVRPGTVHTLMGENGAGKSTLMKCLIGIHPPTSGKIVFEGKEIQFKNTLEALNSGISMIHQELSPVPERSVCENLRHHQGFFYLKAEKLKKRRIYTTGGFTDYGKSNLSI